MATARCLKVMPGVEVRQEAQPGKNRYELYVDGLMDGKTKSQAALAAGFSKNQARHPGRSIEGPVTEALLHKALTREPSGEVAKSRYELYVAGLMDGKTKRRAALDAGFPAKRADHPTTRIEGPITEMLIRKAMAHAGITLNILAEKMREGLDAVRPQVVASGERGKAATVQMIADFETRLKYIQQLFKMLGAVEPEREAQEVRVNIVAVGAREERVVQ
jgi:hypothetical protein